MTSTLVDYGTLTDGEAIQAIEQGSLAHIALRHDSMGHDSPWDTSPLYRRMDSGTQEFLKDVVAEKRRRDSAEGNLRFDAPTPGHIIEALTAYDPDYVEQDYSELNYADPGGPVRIENMNRPGVARIKVQSVNRVGRFRPAGDRSNNSEPLDAGMAETNYPSHYFEAHVNYSTQELDAMTEARRNGDKFGFLDIVQYKLTDVVEAAYNDELNRINALGLLELGIYGLHNHFALPRMQSPILLNELSTPEEYVTIFTAMKKAYINNSGKRLKSIPVVFMPSDLKTNMEARLMGSSGSISVLDWVARLLGIQEIYCPPEADYAGDEGKPVIHGFTNSSRDLKSMVTKPLTQDGRAYKHNGVWRVDYHAAFAGNCNKKPYKHLIMQNFLAA